MLSEVGPHPEVEIVVDIDGRSKTEGRVESRLRADGSKVSGSVAGRKRERRKDSVSSEDWRRDGGTMHPPFVASSQAQEVQAPSDRSRDGLSLVLVFQRGTVDVAADESRRFSKNGEAVADVVAEDGFGLFGSRRVDLVQGESFAGGKAKGERKSALVFFCYLYFL